MPEHVYTRDAVLTSARRMRDSYPTSNISDEEAAVLVDIAIWLRYTIRDTGQDYPPSRICSVSELEAYVAITRRVISQDTIVDCILQAIVTYTITVVNIRPAHPPAGYLHAIVGMLPDWDNEPPASILQRLREIDPLRLLDLADKFYIITNGRLHSVGKEPRL